MKNNLLHLIRFVLVLLYSYVAFSKWFAFRQFVYDTHNQPFPFWMSALLVWMIPLLESAISILLLFPHLLQWGFRLSLLLMSLFTVYVMVVLLGVFNRVPCPCGGFLSELGWRQHLIINLVLIGLSGAGLYLHRSIKKDKNITNKISCSL